MKVDAARVAAIARRWPDDIRLVLLHGPDSAASFDMASQIARQFADPSNPMAIETIAGAGLANDPQALLAAAGALSMFGDRTLVRIDGLEESGLTAVEALVAGRPGNPVVATAGALKKGSKLLGFAERSPAIAAMINYEPSRRDAGRLASDIGVELGLKPSREAALLLFDAASGDRGLLRRELEKMALYLDASPASPRSVEVGDVGVLAAVAGEADQFALAGAVAGGQIALAVDILGRMPSGFGIVALRAVERRFGLLLSLRAQVDAGSSPQQVVDAARPPIFWKEKEAIATEVAAWSSDTIVAALGALLAAERAIKSRGSLGELAAHAALLDLVRRAAIARHRAARSPYTTNAV